MDIHLIGNAHIDPVWLWRWQQGYAEVRATFQSALDRMEEFPDYIFTSACGCYYRWIEELDPDMFTQIRRRVAEGRWEIAGGMWIQPDCNIPSGEAFARHILYTQQYFKEKFGRIATTGYNADSFGHNGMLPQLLRKGGMDSYVFMRPGPHEKDLPGSLFEWYSPDGSHVTAFRIPISYGHWIRPEDRLPGDGDLPEVIAKLHVIEETAAKEGVPLMCFYGVGNHGGGPTISILRSLEDELSKNKNARYSSPTRYFKAIRTLKPELPAVREDLQHHASGCYSANSEIKMLNRRAEDRLVSAEKLMSAAHALTGLPYDRDGINRGWERTLFNQFHDVLAGCSIKSACRDAAEAFNHALDAAALAANKALQSISWRIDTSGGRPPVRSKESDWMLWEYEDRGAPFVVYNPHSQKVRVPVTVNKELAGVTDDCGAPVTIQRVRGEQTNGADKYNTLFMAELPPMGYKLYWLYKNKAPRAQTPDDLTNATPDEPETMPSVTHSDFYETMTLENNFVRLTIDTGTGFIRYMTDKITGNAILADNRSGAVPLAIDESDSDTWAHGIFEFHKEIGRFCAAKATILEDGPLRAAVRVVSFHGDSELRQDFRLYKDDPVVEVAVRFYCNEKHEMFKLSFPTSVKQPKAVYEMPYGYIFKEPDGREEPHQGFVGVVNGADDGKFYGGVRSFAILCGGKYSAEVRGGDIYFTFARTPGFSDHYGVRDNLMEYQDQGVQEFTYRIAYQNDVRIGDYKRLSARYGEQPYSVIETYHTGALPATAQGCSISSEDVLITAFKRAEKLHGYVVRAVEVGGNGAKGVRLDVHYINRCVTADFAPQEIKTLYFPDDGALPVEELSLAELPLNA